MKSKLFVCLALFPSLASGQVMADPLDMAEALAKHKYKGYVYKNKGIEQSIDCTEFLLDVVREFAKTRNRSLTSRQRAAIAIANIEPSEDLQALIAKNDPRIRGVQTALVDAKLGKKVKVADALPGDLVQYWYLDGKTWRGHSGIVEKVAKNKDRFTLTIFGSHATTLTKRADGGKVTRAGGIGTGPRLVLPNARRYKVYLVRWTAKPKKRGRNAGGGK